MSRKFSKLVAFLVMISILVTLSGITLAAPTMEYAIHPDTAVMTASGSSFNTTVTAKYVWVGDDSNLYVAYKMTSLGFSNLHRLNQSETNFNGTSMVSYAAHLNRTLVIDGVERDPNPSNWLVINFGDVPLTAGEVELVFVPRLLGESWYDVEFEILNADYTVKHHLKDVGAPTYTVHDSISMTGVIGNLTAAEAIMFVGFTAIEPLNQQIIEADGSTVVNIYYNRNVYELSYDITGGGNYDTEYYEFDAPVTAMPTPYSIGYTFHGWEGVPGRMPAMNVTATGYYTANTDTEYVVQYYLKGLGTDPYAWGGYDVKTGTTEQLTNAVAKDFEGFSALPFLQKPIMADGSTVVEIYYDRESYYLTYDITGAVFAENAYSKPVYQFGEAITPLANPVQTGYTFSGWSTEPLTMPAHGVTVTGHYIPNTDTKYIVNYWLEDIGAATYTKHNALWMYGTTGDTTAAVAIPYIGFADGVFTQQTIAADGSTEVDIYYARHSYYLNYEITGSLFADPSHEKLVYQYGETVTPLVAPTQIGYTFNGWANVPLTMPADYTNATGYYTPNTDTEYKVAHWQYDVGGATWTLKDVIDKTGTTDELTDAEEMTYDGFTYVAFDQKHIKGDGSTVVDIFYTRNHYAVTYVIKDDPNVTSFTYEFGAMVTPNPTPGFTGYTFHGWFDEPEFMPAHDVEVTGYYKANTDTAYKVAHWQYDVGGATYTLVDVIDKTGTTDSQTNAEEMTYDGFTFVPFDQEPIKYDGTTVVDIFYTRNHYTVSYEIAYDSNVTSFTYEFGATVTPNPTPSFTGYTFHGWFDEPVTMPSHDVTVTGYYKPNTGTLYKVAHWQYDVGGTTYTLKDVEDNYGTTDTQTMAEEMTYEGFTFVPFDQKTIQYDGSTVVDIFYTRNHYTLNYEIEGSLFTDPSYDTEDFEFGAPITEEETPFMMGYMFEGWTPVPAFMPAHDVNVTGYFVRLMPELNKVDHFQYIGGYPDNTVRPEGLVTREEVATIFFRLLTDATRDAYRTSVHHFSDVGASRWSVEAIATLANAGILVGFEDGTFRPEAYATRAEMATIASHFDSLSPFMSDSFTDISGHWANQFINSAAQKGWIMGYPNGTFQPDEAITRAEAVTIVNRMLDRRVLPENILLYAKQFPDLLDTEWYYADMQEAINSHHYIPRVNPEYDFEVWTDIYYLP